MSGRTSHRASLFAATVAVFTALAATLSFATPADAGIHKRRNRYLGPARDIAVLVFPLHITQSAMQRQPMLGLELRVALNDTLAVAVQPWVAWYMAGGVDEDAHGWGIGGRAGLQFYLERRLSGPFIEVNGGDVEAFVAGRRGRLVGGSAVFGFLWNRSSSFSASAGLGLGYWHKMGVLDQGHQFPEVLSLQLGVGWAGP